MKILVRIEDVCFCIYNDLILVTNKSSGIKQVASFPPKLSSPPTDLMSIRTTPPIDDNSSIMEEDITYSEDDELSAYDAQRANEHGEKIILLRKHIRQVKFKIKFISINSFIV